MRTSFVAMLALSAAAVSAAPAAAPVTDLVERGSSSCTFTSAAAVKSGKSSCSTIVLDNIKVPAGETLDLSKLKSGAKVGHSVIQAPRTKDLIAAV